MNHLSSIFNSCSSSSIGPNSPWHENQALDALDSVEESACCNALVAHVLFCFVSRCPLPAPRNPALPFPQVNREKTSHAHPASSLLIRRSLLLAPAPQFLSQTPLISLSRPINLLLDIGAHATLPAPRQHIHALVLFQTEIRRASSVQLGVCAKHSWIQQEIKRFGEDAIFLL